MVDTAVERAVVGDADGALEDLFAQADAVAALEAASAAIMTLYWDRHDVAACVSLGMAAVERGLALSDSTNDLLKRIDILRHVKAIAYNVGSFAWPGWSEPGVTVGEKELARGYEAAELSLQLVVQLKLGAIKESRGHWLVGAHRLAIGDYAAARSSFEEAERLAEAAGVEPERLLNAAYASLVDVLVDPDTQPVLDEIKEKLRAIPEDGESFVSQVDNAMNVFSNR